MKIRECCILLGVEEKKIVWKKKKLLFVDENCEQNCRDIRLNNIQAHAKIGNKIKLRQ